MQYTILGTFDDRENVEGLIDLLKEEGYQPKDISIVMKDKGEAKDLKDDTGADVAEGAVSGATTGALLGGLAGLISAIAIPGLGAFFIGGPIAAALGLTGTAAATVSGATTGLAAGGIVGALMGLGLSDEEAGLYEQRIREGAILVAVPATRGEEGHVKEVFNDFNAANVNVIDNTDKRDDRKTFRSRRDDDEDTTYAYGIKGGKTKTRDE